MGARRHYHVSLRMPSVSASAPDSALNNVNGFPKPLILKVRGIHPMGISPVRCVFIPFITRFIPKTATKCVLRVLVQ